MYRQFGGANFSTTFDRTDAAVAPIVRSGALDALVALERIGSRRNHARDEEIYGEGDPSNCWYKVVAGTVRITKLLADGRRHVAEFCFSGDCFGFDNTTERLYSAEAVDDVVVMRFPRATTDRLIDENPQLVRCLCDMTLRDLAHAQTRMLLLGRMTAPERVASFLLEMFDRRDAKRAVELPMSRTDIADYLGLTIETVCRVLSAFKRAGTIAIPTAHRIELCDRSTLEAVGDT
jgi:CRP/FNR family transcriptional regulator, nitrogen fixation regulation protein